MRSLVRSFHATFGTGRPEHTALTIPSARLLPIFFLLFLALQALPAGAQTFSVIYSFTGGTDGAAPNGVTLDRAGNLYGTAGQGGLVEANCPSGCGTIFKLANRGAGWNLNTLYHFRGGDDDVFPWDLIFGPGGKLYGLTASTAFQLQPPTTICRTSLCSWIETPIYRFTGAYNVTTGNIAFDQAGNLFGVTMDAGEYNAGSVYELTPSPTGWSYRVIHDFMWYESFQPDGGVVVDATGNLVGTTQFGEYGTGGVLYSMYSDGAGNWYYEVSYFFPEEVLPVGNLFLDQNHSLYGITWSPGPDVVGTIYRLASDIEVLYSFGANDGSPYGSPTMDSAGNLYGTAGQSISRQCMSTGCTVFKLKSTTNGWSYGVLHSFANGEMAVNLISDANGNLFGAVSTGGAYGKGYIFEIAP